MFSYSRLIYLSETDATGVLYFTEQLKIAQEAFELYLASKEFYLSEWIVKEEFFFPIVHVSSDFFAPLKVGERILVELHFSNVGNSSLTLETKIWDLEKKKEMGKVRIVHVAVSKETGRSVPLNKNFKEMICNM